MDIILFTEPRKAAELMSSSQFIHVGNNKGELANKQFQEPFTSNDLWLFADNFIGPKSLPTLLKSGFHLCLLQHCDH